MKYTTLPATAGFTLLEILISIGVLTAIAAAGFPVTLDFYHSHQLTTERNSFIAAIRETRNQALSHVGNTDHGLLIASTSYTIFQGSSYAGRTQSQDQLIPHTDSVVISGPPEIVFQSLSGKATSTSFALTGTDNRTVFIMINTEGMIDWHF